MKKIIKTLTIVVIALTAAIACIFVAGCDKKGGNGDYNFTVTYEDGTAVNGKTASTTGGAVSLQICLPGGTCVPLNPAMGDPSLNEKGEVSLSQEFVNEVLKSFTNSDEDVTVFEFHVLNVKNCKSDCKIAVNGKNDYKLTLTAA